MESIRATMTLYHQAARGTVQSFARGWIVVLAVVLFALGLVTATTLVAPLGLIGGFLLGAANALLIGATLGLIREAVLTVRPMRWRDVWDSFGAHFQRSSTSLMRYALARTI